MGGINVGRWLVGGLVAGLAIWVMEGAAAMLYMDRMQAALEAHNLEMTMTGGTWILTILVSLLVGLTLVFFYAVARSRFGPGPRTAAIVALALWVGAYVVSLLGYAMLGLFPSSMLVLWAVIGLAELLIGGMIGGWLYREGAAPVM